MRSFKNDPDVKAKYISRIKAHRAADELIRGTGWDGLRGGAVGCTLESYDHSLYPIELGIPEWVAKLEDAIFEGLPADLAMTWPLRFLEAVPVGITDAQWQSVMHRTAARRMTYLVDQLEPKIGDSWGVVEAVRAVRDLHASESTDRNLWSAARGAARGAASITASITARGAASITASSAACSATCSATWSTTWSSTWSSAWSSASNAAWNSEWGESGIKDNGAALEASYLRESEWLLSAIAESTQDRT